MKLHHRTENWENAVWLWASILLCPGLDLVLGISNLPYSPLGEYISNYNCDGIGVYLDFSLLTELRRLCNVRVVF